MDGVTARLHWLFLLIASGFGLALVFATPPNGGSDEIAHQVKVVRVASGNLFAADHGLLLPDIAAWHGAFSNVNMPDRLRRYSAAELEAALHAPLACLPVTLQANDGLAAYGPLPYLPLALVYKASCGLHATYGAYLQVARIANAALAITLICIGIGLAGPGKWVLFSVGLLPGTMVQLVAVSADALLFGLSFALVGCVSAVLSGRLDLRRAMVPMALAGAALVCGKPGYFWVPWLALAIPAQQLACSPARWREREQVTVVGAAKSTLRSHGPTLTQPAPASGRGLQMSRPGWLRLALLFVVLPLIVQAGLIALAREAAPAAPGVNPGEQIRLLLTKPGHFLNQLTHVPAAAPLGTQWSVLDTLIGLPVWMDTRLPLWLFLALCMGLFGAMGMNPGLPMRSRLFLAALGLVSIVIVTLPLYAFATPTRSTAISGLQGRYFTPTLLILLLAGRFRAPAWVRSAVALLLLALPCVALAQTLALIHWRYFGSPA